MAHKSVIFAKPFRFSPNGVDIVDYKPGKHMVSARCADVAAEAGVLKSKPTPARAPETAAADAAPETAGQ